MKQTKEVIYLLFGGQSPEHEISILTAKQILQSIDKEKYNIFCIYLDKENTFFYLKNFEIFQKFSDFSLLKMNLLKISLKGHTVRFNNLPAPHVCILAFHGGAGESGGIQGFLDILQIPYTGPSVKGCAFSIDKQITRYILEANQVPVLPWISVTKDEWKQSSDEVLKRIHTFCSFPLIVKPSNLGSSIAVTKVENDEALQEAIEGALLYDETILIEQYAQGMIEVSCSVIQKDNNLLASPIEQIQLKTDSLFSYTEKYRGGKKTKIQQQNLGNARLVPAPITKEQEEIIHRSAKNVYKLLYLESLVRIDFFLDPKTNNLYVIEPNAIPGLFSYYLWEAAGIQCYELIDLLINEAKKRSNEAKKIITSFDSYLWKE